MKLLPTIPGFVRLLVGLFVIAQFAGVVSSTCAKALPVAAHHASLDHDQHVHDHGEREKSHHQHGNLADSCCSLHACCIGVLPQFIAVETYASLEATLSIGPNDLVSGISSSRLDRPPRPQH